MNESWEKCLRKVFEERLYQRVEKGKEGFEIERK